MKAPSFLIFLAGFLSVPVTLFAQTCVTPGEGIIAWWSFDDTSGAVVEDIAGNHDGVFVDGTIYSPGEVSNAATFTESNYIGIADDDVWAWGADNFSIECWATLSNPGGSLQHPGDIFICTSNEPGETDKWWFALGNGVLSFHVNHTSPFWYVQTPFSPVLNQWYHLAVTRSADTLRVYIDGALSGTEVVPGLFIYNPDAPLTLGIGEGIGHMNGALDEMTIYNRALSGEEIQAIYSAGSSGKCKSLQITTPLLSDVKFGESFSQTLQAQFGKAPFTWSIVAGQLPNDVSFSEDGILSGTPSEAGEFSFTVQVNDSSGIIAQKDFVLKVLLTLPSSQFTIFKSGTVPVPGRTLDYFIQLENAGNVTDSITVDEFLEPWFTYISSYPAAEVISEIPDFFSEDSTDIQPSVIEWGVTLEPGESALITYKVKLLPEFPVGDTVLGYACISAADHIACIDDYNQCWIERYASCALSCIGGPLVCVACMELASAICLNRLNQCVDDHTHDCSGDDAPTKGAVDPNEMLVLADKYIQTDQLLTYVIEFENIGDIEAQDVFVADVLDTALDASTLNILSSAGSSYDPDTRILRWDLYGINLDVDSSAYVIYSIKPKQNLPSGTIIPNKATIQFEVFDPIETNEVTNIIDYTSPVGVMDPLPAETDQLDFPISWSATDLVGKVKSYTIFVAVDSNGYEPFLTNATLTTDTFSGENGKTYHFICIAEDSAGNTEIQEPVAETTTHINTSCPAIDSASMSVINLSSSSAKVTWNVVAGAEGYKVRYRIKGSIQWTKVGTQKNSKRLDNLHPGTEYVWQVKTYCQIASKVMSDWSAAQYFTTSKLKINSEATEPVSMEIYPVPAKDEVSIQFSLSKPSHVNIKVYDLSGKEIETAFDDELQTGEQLISINTNSFSSGVYLVKVEYNWGTETEKVVVE